MLFIALIFLAAVVAGTFGAMLGLGGGVIVIPVLTIFFKVPMKEAIAASIVTVVATSTSAAVAYVEKHYVNIRLGMLLEMGTTIGAVIGGYTVAYMSPTSLRWLFTVLLMYTAYNMAHKAKTERPSVSNGVYIELPDNATEDEFKEHVNNGCTPYKIKNIAAGLSASLGAGMVSGLLGIGGGIIKVPVMRLAMGVPMRVAIATSNFMIGVTAATSALIYYSKGMINPVITAPSAFGVLIGAQIGTKLVKRINVRILTWMFVVVMIITAIEMALKAVNGAL